MMESNGEIGRSNPDQYPKPDDYGGDQSLKELAEYAKRDLYVFSKAILGYKDLQKRVHEDFCEFIQAQDTYRRLGLMPRGHFKTSLGNADCIRLLCLNPNERILLCSESSLNAESMLEEIAGHFQHNQLFRRLYPDIIPPNFRQTTWNRNALLCPRPGIFREASIEAAGITSKLVSRHYTRIKGDDLISNEAMDSPSVMAMAIRFVNRMESLLVNPLKDTIDIVGTRWAFSDVYSHIIENFPQFKVFIRKALVMGPNGPEPFFPQRYSMEIFQGIIERDPDQWATQYANDPRDSTVTDFRPQWLQYFRVGPDRGMRWDEDGEVFFQSLYECNIYIHVDPSMGEDLNADYSGIVVVALAPNKNIFLLDSIGMRLDPLALAEKIIELAEFYDPKMVTIESNGYQKSLNYYLKEKLRERNIYFRIEPFLASGRKSKKARIRGALRPLFSTQRIWVRKGLTSFIDEYLSFGKADGDEHQLDAFAQGPVGNKGDPFWRYPLAPQAQLRMRKARSSYSVNRGVTGYGV